MVTLDTSALGTYSFYIWGYDGETRWDNYGVSVELTIEVSCGSEVISAASSTPAEVLELGPATTALSFASLSTSFSSTKPVCPVSTFTVFSDAALVTQ